MYWYRFQITNADTTTTIYKVTLVAPIQQITDIWDGVYRTIGSFQYYKAATPGYQDFTSNVSSDTFNSLDEGTYAKLGGFTFASDALYVGAFERLFGFKVSFIGGFSNTNACNMNVFYWNGIAWTPVSGLNDGTKTGLISFNKGGTVVWDPPTIPSEFKQVLAGSSGRTGISVRYIPEVGDSYYITNPPSNPISTIDLYYYKITFTGDGTTTAFPTESTTVGVRPYNMTFIPAPTEITGYKFAIEHAQRLWLCNNTSGEANIAVASSLDTSQIFNGTDSFKQYFGDDTGLVGAVTLYSKVATVINNTALFFKQNETWALDDIAPTYSGQTPTKGSRLISGSIGCVAPYTIDSADVEVSPANFRRVAIWQSQQGIMVSFGESPIDITGDISDLFDPMRDIYLGASVLATCHGFIDPQKNEYHWIIPGVTTYVFDITRKKWYEAPRTATTRLIGGIVLYDIYGVSYIYGFGANYMWRLDNGYTFDGEDIPCSFRFGDIALDNGSIFARTSIKSTKLIAKSLSTSANDINFYHYGDGATAASTFKAITPTNAGKRIFGEVKPNSAGSNIFHSFKYAFNVNASATGFEPIYVGINYSKDNIDL
jgi:hypothetical protein